MNGVLTLSRPDRVAFLQGLGDHLMDIFLHVGAHCTGSAKFQHYLNTKSDNIAASGMGVWGPRQTRLGLFTGLFPAPGLSGFDRSANVVNGRVSLYLNKTRDLGLTQLLVSDENMIGSTRHCMRSGALYPAIGERMARFGAAFGNRVTRVAVSIRSPEVWWECAIQDAVSQGHAAPGAAVLDEIAAKPRTWRDVITDLACALPNARIKVFKAEEYAARPDALYTHFSDNIAPDRDKGISGSAAEQTIPCCTAQDAQPALERSRADRVQAPLFTTQQITIFREAYADDLFWLAAGADGLASLAPDPNAERAGTSLPQGDMTEGHTHDSRQRKLAQSG